MTDNENSDKIIIVVKLELTLELTLGGFYERL